MYKKLLAIQKEIGGIKKSETNPFFKSKYFDINTLLEAVKPVLSKYNLVLIQPLQGDSLQTIIIDTETSEKVESSVILPTNPDPQKMGAIITYFRRYSLQSLLALQAEDDDANSASGKVESLEKIGKCNLCGEQGQKSAKGYVFCPNWQKHKDAGEKPSFVFPPKKLTKNEEEFVKELTEEEENAGLNK